MVIVIVAGKVEVDRVVDDIGVRVTIQGNGFRHEEEEEGDEEWKKVMMMKMITILLQRKRDL